MSEPVCYSKRLLNPFSGTVQVLTADNARATSTDGVNWRIQIQSEIFKTPWHELEMPTSHERYFVYGVWSKTGGIAKAPIHPTLYQEHVAQSAEGLIEQLIKVHDKIPFPAADIFECWLLDEKQYQPLALLNTCISEELVKLPRQSHWLACGQHDRSFTSSAFDSRQKNATISLQAKDMLSDLIKKYTGAPAAVIWVKRDKQGHGHLIKHNQPTSPCPENVIAADSFPTLGIRQQWESADEQQLINDYLQWLSPRLLALPELTQETRARLEIAAQHQPLIVDQYHRLYPEVVDSSLLNKILVEAAMRKGLPSKNSVRP